MNANGNWRLFGGAGIILSRGLVQALAPELVPYFHDLDSKETTGKKPRHGPGAYEAVTHKRRLLAISGAPPHKKSAHRSKSKNVMLSPKAFLLDIALPKFIKSSGFTYYHLVGMYSQPPGFYLTTMAGKRDEPAGLSDTPITFHYIRGDYVHHLDFLAAQMRLCAVPNNWQSTTIGVGLLRGKADRTPGQEQESKDNEMQRPWERNLKKVTFRGSSHCLIRTLVALGRELPNLDWYIIVHDSVYVVEQNLRSLVGTYNPGEPVVLGHIVEMLDGSKYANLSAGILVSRTIMAALEKIVSKIPDKTKFGEIQFGQLIMKTAPSALKHFDGFVTTTTDYPFEVCAVTISSIVDLGLMKPKNKKIEGSAGLMVIDYFVRKVVGSGKLRPAEK